MFKALSHIKKGEYIYPGLIVKYTNLSMNESYEVLNSIEHMGIVERVFLYECPKCGSYQYYNSLSEIKVELYCKSCGYSENENVYSPRSVLQALKIIYQVIKE